MSNQRSPNLLTVYGIGNGITKPGENEINRNDMTHSYYGAASAKDVVCEFNITPRQILDSLPFNKITVFRSLKDATTIVNHRKNPTPLFICKIDPASLETLAEKRMAIWNAEGDYSSYYPCYQINCSDVLQVLSASIMKNDRLDDCKAMHSIPSQQLHFTAQLKMKYQQLWDENSEKKESPVVKTNRLLNTYFNTWIKRRHHQEAKAIQDQLITHPHTTPWSLFKITNAAYNKLNKNDVKQNYAYMLEVIIDNLSTIAMRFQVAVNQTTCINIEGLLNDMIGYLAPTSLFPIETVSKSSENDRAKKCSQ